MDLWDLKKPRLAGQQRIRFSFGAKQRLKGRSPSPNILE
jgi:hypothetical protein